MKRSCLSLFPIRAVVCAALLWVAEGSRLPAQQPPQPPPPSQALASNQLDDLVAPIALYPDPLLSQILVASTYPLELVQALQWLGRNPGLAGAGLTQAAQQQNWDPSIQALVVFPDLVKRLNQDITWTTNLGNAFLSQQAEVMDAVQRMRLRAQQTGKLAFTVGTGEWPFPVPVILKDGRWQLDPESGRLEILARRIGKNELNVMEVCRGYAEAQMEFAAGARDGDGVLKYAQKIVSTPGKHDGLYSQGGSDELVSQAFALAEAANSPGAGKKVEPYHGYYFRVLKSQGPDTAGGAFDYVVNGKMIGGFALVAWPAEYGVSGVRTLIINHDGVVYEKDLGAGTASQARQMTRFNTDKSWERVTLE